MAPVPQTRRGFDADAFAQQMQHAADRRDADTLDALGEQLRDVLDEDLRATLTDMYERLRAGLAQPQPRQPEAPQRPPSDAAPAPLARRRTAWAEQVFQGETSGGGVLLLPPASFPSRAAPAAAALPSLDAARSHAHGQRAGAPLPARPAA
jgi:hypothetical protein